MTHPLVSRASTWAENAYSLVDTTSPPVDLHAIARYQSVKRVGLRLMIPRGALVPISGGFEVFMRDLDSRELNIDAPEIESRLSHRQRFSYAHEVAHTLFYDRSRDVPIPVEVTKKYPDLEAHCNRNAARLLLPTRLVKNEIKRELGDPELIDAKFISRLTEKFRTSYQVTIERLRMIEPANAFARCILLVTQRDGDAQVPVCYFGAGLASTLPSPKQMTKLSDWLPELPKPVLERKEDGKWEMNVAGNALKLEKLSLGPTGSFLLQVDNLSRRNLPSR